MQQAAYRGGQEFFFVVNIQVRLLSNGFADLFFIHSFKYRWRTHLHNLVHKLYWSTHCSWGSRLDCVSTEYGDATTHELRLFTINFLAHNRPIIVLLPQVPGTTTYNLSLYYMMRAPLEENPLLHRFVNGDDAFRNSRFKLIPYISKVNTRIIIDITTYVLLLYTY